MSVANRMTPTDVSAEAKRKFEEDAEDFKDVDFLGVDRTIPGQTWVCLSFVSPEEFIKQRHLFYFEKFLKTITQKLDVPENMSPDFDVPKSKFDELLKGDVSYAKVKDAWETFLEMNNEKLSQVYEEESGGRTSVRGLKIRGSYATYQEAKHQSDRLAEIDKNHHVYIGQVGYWLPWDPNPAEVPEQEYQNKQLNMLMKKYEENLSYRDRFYEERKQEKLREAIERNRKKKEEREAAVASAENGDGEEVKVAPVPDRKQTMEDLERVRHIVQEKNKIMQKQKEKEKASKSKNDDQKLVAEDEELLSSVKAKKSGKRKGRKKGKPKKSEVSTAAVAASHTQDEDNDQERTEEIRNVFNAPDPWLQRKAEQSKKEKKKKK